LKRKLTAAVIVLFFISCSENKTKENTTSNPIIGTWKLVKGTVIDKGDTIVTDYTKNLSFIKIINPTHFAFLQHDVNKDSTASFVAGGGRYSLKDSTYTEHLEYCNAREWEGHDFPFIVTIKNDTLTQSGVEKIEGTNVNRINTEEYVRLKDSVAKK
jgi:hypothetical protein